MEPNLSIVLFSNILLLILLIFRKNRSNLHAHITALLICIINVLYVYILLKINELDADFKFLGVDLPYPFVLLIIGSIFALYYKRDISNKIIYLFIFAFVCNFFLLRPYNAIPYLFDPQSEVMGKTVALLLVINPFLLCAILPLALLMEENKTIYDNYFSFKSFFQNSNFKSIIAGIISYTIIYYFFSLYMGGIITINKLEPFSIWARYILWQFTFGSLIDFIVLILFPHFIITKVLGLKNDLLLILILGIIFGLARFSTSFPIAVWYLFFGMIFAYLYIRTKSLTYGLILYSTTEILFFR